MMEAADSLAGAREAAELTFTYSRPEQPSWQRLMVLAVERLTGARRFERLYGDWSAAPRPETIFAAGLRLLKIGVEYDGTPLSALPRTGPLLIIANHPFGVIDGLAIANLATELRPDAKIMTHSLLCQPPEALPYLLPVDFACTASARAATMTTCRRALSWLAGGHALAMFPGGSVSTSQSPWHGPAIDPAWYPFLGKLATTPGLTIVPVFIHGQNSRLFQIASHVHYALRIALLFRESALLEDGRVRMSIGEPLTLEGLPRDDRGALVKALRRRCYGLSREHGRAADREFQWPKHIRWD